MVKPSSIGAAVACLLVAACGTTVAPPAPPPPPPPAAAAAPPAMVPASDDRVAAHRLAPPQVTLEPQPTAAVLLTDRADRSPANVQFCETFFATTPSVSQAIDRNQNVVQVFWPTLDPDPGKLSTDPTSLATWCPMFLRTQYDYKRAQRYLDAIGSSSEGPVVIVMASGDLRHPSLVLDGGRVSRDQAAVFAGYITQAVDQVSSEPATDQQVERTALVHAAAAKKAAAKTKAARAKTPAMVPTCDVKANPGDAALQITVPRCAFGGPDAMTPGSQNAAPAPRENAEASYLNADTNVTMRKVCNLTESLQPLIRDVPVIGVGGDVFNAGVCEGAVKNTFNALKAFL